MVLNCSVWYDDILTVVCNSDLLTGNFLIHILHSEEAECH